MGVIPATKGTCNSEESSSKSSTVVLGCTYEEKYSRKSQIQVQMRWRQVRRKVFPLNNKEGVR